MTYPVGQAAPACSLSHAALAPAPPTPYPAPQTNIVCSLAQQLGIAIVVELLKMAVFGDLSL